MWYGTRLATILLVRRNGDVLFLERDVYVAGADEAAAPVNVRGKQSWVEGEAADWGTIARFVSRYPIK